MAISNHWEFVDDFIGGGTFGASASEGDSWVITDTSSSGTPTYARVDHSESTGDYAAGVAKLQLASTSEVENVCLNFGDKLSLDLDKVRAIEFRLKQSQATIDSATSLSFGLSGDRNDAIDSMAVQASFQCLGTNSVTVETDDGTNNNDDKSTGQTLTNAYKIFKIDFANGTDDVRFYMDGGNGLTRVAAGTTFDMSNHTGGVQPFIQLQKTADTNTDGVEIDYVKVWGVR